MNLNLLLEMAAGGHGDRIALGSAVGGVSFAELAERAAAGGELIRERGARHVLYLGRNGAALPQAMFAAVAAGTPFTPLNYRLSSESVVALTERFDNPLVLVEGGYADVPIPPDLVWDLDAFVASSASRTGPPLDSLAGDDAPAVMLFTSGTTAEPKVISLSHDNLTSYVIETVEFGSASEDECALTSTPPYHIAAIASILSNLYAGRRVVYLPDFDAERWLSLVRDESVTSAMIVPTMMSRIVDQLDGQRAAAPSLRQLSYGGSRSVPSVVESAMAAFPTTDFCNAYGLTETSSTVALLGPEDHRLAVESDDPAMRRRLSSVGRPVPGVEMQVRGESGELLPPESAGELWLRSRQVATGTEALQGKVDDEGWFATSDRARMDADGYIFVEGRLDDTIIRGGENIAPSEIEDVLRLHPAVADVAVVGLADEQWGQLLVAVVVARDAGTADEAELREWVRGRLRGSRTPDRVEWTDELPYSPTGKLLRREVVETLYDDGSVSHMDGR